LYCKVPCLNAQLRRFLQNLGAPDLDPKIIKILTKTVENFDALNFLEQTAIQGIYNETQHGVVYLFAHKIPDKFIIEKLQKRCFIDEFTNKTLYK
jgi:hypothetical protein